MLPRLLAAGILAEETMRVGFFRRRTGRIDLRNHRKIAVIDGRIAYIGSQNLVDATFKRGLTYEELNVRLSGPIALELQAVFVEDWYVETGETLGDLRYFPDPRIAGDVTAQTLPSGPGYPRENNQRLIVSLIHAAARRIVITMPYLVPDEALLQALQTAVLRGIDVTLVVPLQMDQILVCLAQRSYYDELLGLRRPDLSLWQAFPACQARHDRRHDRVDRLVEPRHPLVRAERRRSSCCSTTPTSAPAWRANRRAICATGRCSTRPVGRSGPR